MASQVKAWEKGFLTPHFLRDPKYDPSPFSISAEGSISCSIFQVTLSKVYPLTAKMNLRFGRYYTPEITTKPTNLFHSYHKTNTETLYSSIPCQPLSPDRICCLKGSGRGQAKCLAKALFGRIFECFWYRETKDQIHDLPVQSACTSGGLYFRV